MASLELATHRALPPEQREEVLAVQRQALRWTFLGSGMTHGNFLGTLERLGPAARARVEEVAPAFCFC